MGNWRTDSIEVRFSAFDSIEDLFWGFWTKHLRNCNSDSIEDKVFRQKADFVDCVSFNKLSM